MVPWLEQLHDALRQRGLPSWYVRRLMKEVSDHLMDGVQEARDMGAQPNLSTKWIEEHIGRCDDLADAALMQLRRRTLCGRRPWLTLLLAPPVLFIALLLLYIVPVVAAATWLDHAATSRWAQRAFVTMCHGAAYVPPAVAAVLLCCWATASGRGWRWYVPACGMVAVLAATFMISCQLPTTPGAGRLTMGFGFGADMFPYLHGVLPLSIAALCFWLERYATRRARYRVLVNDTSLRAAV